ncbi:MAG: ATP-binding cassette domain-containing protein [Bacteroidales bacterium]|nr:ATP-binding cassette domain-containing protein [Bacteroidales bacterium]
MIEIRNLKFSYGNETVLENISMNLEEGRVYGLLGENGVGKTTLLTLLCGLKKCQEGSILIDGRDPYKREPSLLGNIYYLPDEVAGVPMKAEEYARNWGLFWPEFDLDKFMTIMSELETDPSKRMDRMSCGQLKKSYISFALACNCRYIFLDEPTNGLDIPSKAEFRKAVMKHTSESSTLLISTHQVRDLENIIDPVIILDRRDVLLNAGISEIAEKLYFDYGNERAEGALYSEFSPVGNIQVCLNAEGRDSKVNLEALFNAVHGNKALIKGIFNK